MSKPDPSTEELLTRRGEFIRRMFASIAHIYDMMNSVLSLMFDRRWRNAAAKAARLSHDALILDVCAGTGKQALHFLRVLGPQARVVAADFCREMIVAGRQRMRRSDRSALSFIVADTLMLPFGSGTFDAVSASFGIRNVADTERGIAEMVRVARPGGRIVILDFARPRGAVFGKIYELYFTRIVPLVGRLAQRKKTSPYDYLPKSVWRFVTAAELGRLLEKHGCAGVTITELTLGVAALVVGTKRTQSPEMP